MKKVVILILGILLLFWVFPMFHYRQINQRHQDIIYDMTHSINKKGSKYYGYLEIPKLHIKRVIVNRYNQKLLDKDFICVFKQKNFLQEETGNTLLAGHNNKGLFLNLNKLKKKDKLYIYIREKKFVYQMISSKVVKYDSYIYEEERTTNVITIITCTKDKTKRLLVTFQLINE